MQIFYRNVLAIETNEYYTRGILVKTSGKRAVIKKWNEIVHKEKNTLLLSDSHLENIKQLLDKVGRDIEDYVVLNFPFSRMIFSVQKMPPLSTDQLLKAVSFKISEETNISPSNLVVDVSLPKKKQVINSEFPIFTAKKEFMDRYLSRILSVAKCNEPDILLPDNLKFLELMDQNCLISSSADKNFTFIICEDVPYSVLFTFKSGTLVQISEIPYSLKYLLESLEEKGMNRSDIIKIFLKGTEMGSLEHITGSNDIFEDYYRHFVYECEKTISNTMNKMGISENKDAVQSILICSMNKRNSRTITNNLLRSKVLMGIRISELPLKNDYPENMDSLRGLMGLAYRGVRELGKYKFV